MGMREDIKESIKDKRICVSCNEKNDGSGEIEKKEAVQYRVEREFLSKFSAEELLVRIVKSHLKKDEKRGSLR